MDSHVIHLPQIAQIKGTGTDDPHSKQFRNTKHAAEINVRLTHVLNSYSYNRLMGVSNELRAILVAHIPANPCEDFK